MKRYAVVIERAGKNFSAYVPDLPGCVATGKTVAQVEKEISEAIAFHIEGLRDDGLPVPEPVAPSRDTSALAPDSALWLQRHRGGRHHPVGPAAVHGRERVRIGGHSPAGVQPVAAG